MPSVKIKDRYIGSDHAPFIIAELSGNHNKSLARALKLVDAAAAAGADAIKLQTYRPDTITIDQRGGLFEITDPNSLWHGKNLYELYGEAMTPWEWHKEIFEYARSLGLIAFSSPFDETAVDFLEELNVPTYKIASFENNHFPLLKKVSETGKPVIISSGVTNFNDLKESVEYLEACGCREIIVLKCTSSYPASAESFNLNTISHFIKSFPDAVIGLSDHSLSNVPAYVSVGLGVRCIEKHLTISRADGGVDAGFSLEPDEFKALVDNCRMAFDALGEVQLEISEKEQKSAQFKRSIYVIKDIKAGEPFSKNNLKVIRPGDGLAPKHYESVLGKLATKDYYAGNPFEP